jgi:hypothetical protein
VYAWNCDELTIPPSHEAGEQGPPVEFSEVVESGGAIEFESPFKFKIMESGYFSINWRVYKSGYDCAFALFAGEDGKTPEMIPGSCYGAMGHDESYAGQTIASLKEGEVLTLNRVDDLYTLTITNQIGGGIPVTSASISIVMLA